MYKKHAVFKKTQIHLFYNYGTHGYIQLIEYSCYDMSSTYHFDSFHSQKAPIHCCRHAPTVADKPGLFVYKKHAVFKKTQIHLFYNYGTHGYIQLIEYSCYDMSSTYHFDSFHSQKAPIHCCRHAPTVADKPGLFVYKKHAVFKKTQIHLFYNYGTHGYIQLIEYSCYDMSSTYHFDSFHSQKTPIHCCRHAPTVADKPGLFVYKKHAVFKKTQIHLFYNYGTHGYIQLIEYSCYDMSSTYHFDSFHSQKTPIHCCRHAPTVADKPGLFVYKKHAVFKKTQLHLLYNSGTRGYIQLIEYSCYDMS